MGNDAVAASKMTRPSNDVAQDRAVKMPKSALTTLWSATATTHHVSRFPGGL